MYFGFQGIQDLVATGSLLSCNPQRVVLKRIVLSGHPFKINRRSAVVRYMFFNRGKRILLIYNTKSLTIFNFPVTLGFMTDCLYVSSHDRWYHVVQTSGASNKVGSERAHQRGLRFGHEIVFETLSCIFNLPWILTVWFHFSGTHGHMKCVFDNQLRSQDTVLMNLYKRVYPRWTYDPYVPLPLPWVKSEVTVEMDDSDME